jgi:16S rRNA processing protein RimM
VEILTDRPDERFRRGATLFAEGSVEPLTITSGHPDEPGWLVRFAEIRDRSAAERLRDAYLEAVVGPGEEPGRGEYYWHEVVGTPVRGVDGADLGRVEDVYRVGGAEVFVVRGGPFGEFDLPVVRAFIRIFAPRRGEIVIDADALALEPPRPPRPRGRRSTRAQVAGDVVVGSDRHAPSEEVEGRDDHAAPPLDASAPKPEPVATRPGEDAPPQAVPDAP